MRFQTEDGRSFDAGISHEETTIPRYPGVRCRQTVVWLRCEGNKHHPPILVEKKSVCSPNDMFSRKIGRHKARSKFLEIFQDGVLHEEHGKLRWKHPLSEHFTRDDRRLIYKMIMPEYNSSPKKKRYKKCKTDIVQEENKGDALVGVHKIEGGATLQPTSS